MNYKVIIVEDDKGIADAVSICLNGWQMEARTIKDFRQVLEEISDYQPHLVLMDITLPYMSGYHWCRELRKVSSVPIIFISSASDNLNIVMAMNFGADDFIAKPFDESVLIAKIQALLRRSYDFPSASKMHIHNGALLNTGDNSLSFKDKKIELTKNEYRILLCLFEGKGKVVSRERLMERLWESDAFIDDNTLTVNINRLRKKLDSVGLADFIKTKIGVGYILE